MGVPAQVSSTSLDQGSKLRGTFPKALLQLNSATLILDQLINQLYRRCNQRQQWKHPGSQYSLGNSDCTKYSFEREGHLLTYVSALEPFYHHGLDNI
ncbi:hypothetical protein TNCV_1725281 [Trichonephila clavipes]|nr:hypothetical protein TNCV_1725281 [Trichonephila clavipes]